MRKLVDKFVPVAGAVAGWWLYTHAGVDWRALVVIGGGWWIAPQVWGWLKSWSE